MTSTPIPTEEIEVFKRLPNLRTIVDVGAREDVDYLSICPQAEFHLFEPNPVFFESLKKKVSMHIPPKVYLNNCGLSDKQEVRGYNYEEQAFESGENSRVTKTTVAFPLITLDSYVKERQLSSIDFLKVDAEGYDYRVLVGAQNSWPIIKFLQYEYWDKPGEFHDLLHQDFILQYIGYRNVLGINRKLVSEEEAVPILGYIGFHELHKL